MHGFTWRRPCTYSKGAGFEIAIAGKVQHPAIARGAVVAQHPTAGARHPVAEPLRLTLSLGSGVVPVLMGRSPDEAQRLLFAAGLRMGRVDRVWAILPAGRIAGQSPPPLQRAAFGTPVDVQVSTGPLPPEPAGRGRGKKAKDRGEERCERLLDLGD